MFSRNFCPKLLCAEILIDFSSEIGKGFSIICSPSIFSMNVSIQIRMFGIMFGAFSNCPEKCVLNPIIAVITF